MGFAIRDWFHYLGWVLLLGMSFTETSSALHKKPMSLNFPLVKGYQDLSVNLGQVKCGYTLYVYHNTGNIILQINGLIHLLPTALL